MMKQEAEGLWLDRHKWNRGADSWLLIRLCAYHFERLFPRRWRGGPPLLYPIALASLLWGVGFLLLRMTGLDVSAWMRVYPAPPVPSATWDAIVTTAAILAVVQALGTLTRSRWGILAVYVWLALSAIIAWMPPPGGRSWNPADIVGALLSDVVLGCILVYYHARRRWLLPSGDAPTRQWDR